MKNCGERTKTQELFPEILIKVERDFRPTSKEPNRPAAAYLQMRGLSESLKDLPFEYWRDVRRTGKGAVMFPIDKEKTIWNGRLFDPPPGEGKTHNVGSTAGVVWRHPGIKYLADEETFVVEGIFDALSFIEMGFQAVSILAAGQDPANIDLSEFKRIMRIPVMSATHSGGSRPPVPYSGDFGHPFRRKSATCSGRSRPPIPDDSGHRFRLISATHSGPCRPPCRSKATLFFLPHKLLDFKSTFFSFSA